MSKLGFDNWCGPVRYFRRSAVGTVAQLISASLWHALVEHTHSVGNDLSPVDTKLPPETDL